MTILSLVIVYVTHCDKRGSRWPGFLEDISRGNEGPVCHKHVIIFFLCVSEISLNQGIFHRKKERERERE